MNILFIHEVDWLAKVVFDIHFLAEGLSLLGHKVYAIDYEDTWSRKELFNLKKLKTREVTGVSRAFDGSSVDLIRPGFLTIPVLSRVSAAFTHYLEIQRTIRDKAIDAVILYSIPTNGLQAVLLARRFNIPIIFRSIDILNILVSSPPLRRVTRLLEKRVYSGVDIVLPNTPQYLNYVLRMGAPESKARLLPFPLDTELFHPDVDFSEVKKKWSLEEEKPMVVFIGTLFDFSGLDEFIKHFPQVLKEIPETKLLIVGDGPQRAKLEQIIRELRLEEQVIITGFQPYRTMPEYINLATVCINSFVINEDTMDIFPAKIMQYVACGKATVATALRGIATLLPDESHGVVYSASPSEMTGEVISLLKSPERRQRIEKAGLNQIREKYSQGKIALELESILEELVKEKQSDSGQE